MIYTALQTQYINGIETKKYKKKKKTKTVATITKPCQYSLSARLKVNKIKNNGKE